VFANTGILCLNIYMHNAPKKPSIDNLTINERQQFGDAYDVAQVANGIRNRLIIEGTIIAPVIKRNSTELNVPEFMTRWQDLNCRLNDYIEVVEVLMPPRKAFEPKTEAFNLDSAREFMTPEQLDKAINIIWAMRNQFGSDIKEEFVARTYPIIMQETETGEKTFTVVSRKPTKLAYLFNKLPFDATRLIEGDMPNAVFNSNYSLPIYAGGVVYDASLGMTAELYTKLFNESVTYGRPTFRKKDKPVLLLGEPFSTKGRKPIALVNSDGELVFTDLYAVKGSAFSDPKIYEFELSRFDVIPAITVE
jgi:hypothetical protein